MYNLDILILYSFVLRSPEDGGLSMKNAEDFMHMDNLCSYANFVHMLVHCLSTVRVQGENNFKFVR